MGWVKCFGWRLGSSQQLSMSWWRQWEAQCEELRILREENATLRAQLRTLQQQHRRLQHQHLQLEQAH
eukprot:9153552-Prorocentrum_lima.AAC.1